MAWRWLWGSSSSASFFSVKEDRANGAYVIGVPKNGDGIAAAILDGPEIKYFGFGKLHRAAGAALFLNEQCKAHLRGRGFKSSWLVSGSRCKPRQFVLDAMRAFLPTIGNTSSGQMGSLTCGARVHS